MHRLIWTETRKLWHLPGVLVASTLCLLFVAYAYWQTSSNVASGLWSPRLLDPTRSLTYTLALLATVVPLLAAVVGAISVGQEFGYGTWSALLTHGATREQVWVAKIGSVAVTILVWLLATLTLGFGAIVLMSGGIALPQLDAGALAQVAVVGFAMLFWGSFAFTCGMVFRGTAGAVALGIGFPFLEMALESVPLLRDWLPVWNQRALNAAVFGTTPIGMVAFPAHPSYPSLAQAVTILIVLFLALTGTSFALMKRSTLL